jgi:hypothetical protein
MGIIVNNIQRGTLAFKGKGVSRVYKGSVCVFQKYFETFPDGCIAYFKMDELSGSVATDALGNYNGTNTNIIYGNSGNNGLCYKFNGIDSNIEIPYLLPVYNFAISIWINLSNASNDLAILFDTGFANSTSYFYLSYYRGTITGRIANTRGTFQQGFSVSSTTGWIHIVATVDNSGYLRLYENNSLKVTLFVYYRAETSEKNVRVGLSWFYDRNPYSSFMDDVMIFDRFLTATEINELYNNQI